MRTVCLAAPTSADAFAAWRAATRELVVGGVPPHEISWQIGARADLFVEAAQAATGAASATDVTATFDLPDMSNDSNTVGGNAPRPHFTLPRPLLALLASAARFRAHDRWAFLYRVVWRWHGGDHAVASAADRDGARLHAMARAVDREIHKMNAFLRFHERPSEAGVPRFVAWIEPEHEVLEPVAKHFAERMGQLCWAIATPDACAISNGAVLEMGPPLYHAPPSWETSDATEELWTTYYRSIFNPVRVNRTALQAHMPPRYWKQLPEAHLIPSLLSDACTNARRTAQAAAVAAVAASTGARIQITPQAAQPARDPVAGLDACRRCDLWRNATHGVPGAGPRKTRIMVVGEQPGDQEDLQGKPFVGPAGRLLDDAFKDASIARDEVYLTNAVKHFKWVARGKRRLHKTPSQREVEACAYWLSDEIDKIKPQIIVALGATALRAVLASKTATLKDALGAVLRHDGRAIMPTYHPSFVLRAPDQAARDAAYRDIVAAIARARALLSNASGEAS